MTEKLIIEGMMCPHCEARVKTALEQISGVTSAEVSHKDKSAVVTCDDSVSREALKSAVEQAGYTVL